MNLGHEDDDLQEMAKIHDIAVGYIQGSFSQSIFVPMVERKYFLAKIFESVITLINFLPMSGHCIYGSYKVI